MYQTINGIQPIQPISYLISFKEKSIRWIYQIDLRAKFVFACGNTSLFVLKKRCKHKRYKRHSDGMETTIDARLLVCMSMHVFGFTITHFDWSGSLSSVVCCSPSRPYGCFYCIVPFNQLKKELKFFRYKRRWDREKEKIIQEKTRDCFAI